MIVQGPGGGTSGRGVLDNPVAGSRAFGRHVLIDCSDCNPDLLNTADGLKSLLLPAAREAGATVLSAHVHRFDSLGVTAFAILAESHISIHTWPELRHAAVDIYTCGDCDAHAAQRLITRELSSARFDVVDLPRGRGALSEAAIRPGADNGLWFFEDAIPGARAGAVSHGFAMSQVVFDRRTRFQDCLIFDNPLYGRVLVLDGIVQLSTSDEHIYHEMLVHPAMFAHPAPRRVVIIGGGDGGTLREVLRHNPDQVVMIDIDDEFVRAAACHLPGLSAGAFEDPRVTMVFEDASEVMSRYEGAFDVAIIDGNSAIGPSVPLFETAFFGDVARALTADGIAVLQAGSLLDNTYLWKVDSRLTAELGSTAWLRLTVPCFHCGDYVFMVASRTSPSGYDVGAREQRQSDRGVETRYWSPSIDEAARVLPAAPFYDHRD